MAFGQTFNKTRKKANIKKSQRGICRNKSPRWRIGLMGNSNVALSN